MLISRIIHLLIIALIFFSGPLEGQINESGSYPLYNFSSKQYNGLGQNWCAVQDQRGIMYYGNNSGVIEYDGVNWGLIGPSNGYPVYSMAADDSGRIYFGSIDEFGYLIPDTIGQLEYKLLSDLLNEEDRNFGGVWETYFFDNKVVFQAFNHIFIWNNDSIEVIYSEDEISESFYIGERLFISFTDKGLSYLDGSHIIPIENTDRFSNILISGMMEMSDGNILIASEKYGFYKLNFTEDNPGQTIVRQIRTKNDSLFYNVDIFNIQALSPNRISLGTWGYGAIIIDSLFNIIAVIDKDAGLQDDIVQGQYKDMTGNLWLTLSNGISRIETQTNLSQFNDKNGIEGTVQAITRFNNRIYATTNIGLFCMGQEVYNSDYNLFSNPVFKLLEDFEFECWDMITYSNEGDEVLLIISNDEVYELTRDHHSSVIISDYSNRLFQSVSDPRRVYIGMEDGLKSIYRQDHMWIDEGQFENISVMITDFSEKENDELWIGTEDEGIVKINFEGSQRNSTGEYTIVRYNQEQGLPSGPFVFSQFSEISIIATNKGLFRFDSEAEYFYADSSFGDQFADGTFWIHRISKNDNLGMYMFTFSEDLGMIYELGYVEKNSGTLFWISQPFSRISEDLIHAVFQEFDGIVWFGGSEGIYRFDQGIKKNYKVPFNAYIRTVESSGGKPIFKGAFPDENDVQSLIQPDSWQFELPYYQNSLVFKYAAQPGEDESFTRYSYFLDGNDEDWCAWTEETKSVYTNLHEGDYVYHVKARNLYGHISSECTYEFTILAPWFRSVWAYILYIILAVVVVYLIVILYTRRLREIIRERTAEVVAQKEVIEEKNNDIMDSILYAEKIQRAMMPPEDDLGKMDLDGFILFMPLNIVSGDFYWLGKKDWKIITVAADCTGHGVPGAFMSMLGVAFLNNIVGAQGIISAAEILDELRAEVIAALKQKGHEGEQKDGMDLALHVIDTKAMKLEFAGANNPLILIRDNELIQVKADRMPIGIHERADEPFQNQVFDLQKGDVIYTFSDGYQDQFGGPKNKKFMIKRLKELFLEIHQKPMEKQKEILEKTFYDWIVPYDADQIDDIIVIGIRV